MKRELAAVLVTALMMTGTATLPAAAAGPGLTGRIAFDDGDGPVYTVSPRGTGLKMVASGHDLARWSTDGRRISLVDFTADGRVTTAVMKADGSELRTQRIPDPTLNLQCPAWAPGDKLLACEGWDDARPERRAGIFTVRSADWHGLTRLTSNPFGGHDIPGDYSPDGREIVFVRENPNLGALALFTVDRDGDDLRQLTPWGGVACCTANWSPDGRWILFATGNGTISKVSPTGRRLQQLQLRAPERSVAFQPGWSPDGQKIVFTLITPTGPDTRLQGIYTANADGTKVRPVYVTATGFPSNPDWGPRS
jgi:Tol biopolymer transport system component